MEGSRVFQLVFHLDLVQLRYDQVKTSCFPFWGLDAATDGGSTVCHQTVASTKNHFLLYEVWNAWKYTCVS